MMPEQETSPEIQRMIAALESVPETRLSILDLLETLPNPNSWNQHPLTEDQERELDEAIQQANSYIQKTQRLRRDIEQMLRRDR